MTAMMKAKAIDESMLHELEHVEAGEQSNPLATLWLAALGLMLGATLICTVVLMAWPLVAQYASKLH